MFPHRGGCLPRYLSYPADLSTKYAILILRDVIGRRLINTQYIVDQFAANGYSVVMPALFLGGPEKLNRPVLTPWSGSPVLLVTCPVELIRSWILY